MTIWIDAQLSPSLAKWMSVNLGVKAIAVRELGLRDSGDFEIFQAAREANAVVLTKDADFPHLLSQHGPPPQILWLTCGNSSNENVRRILTRHFPKAVVLLQAGESLVEMM